MGLDIGDIVEDRQETSDLLSTAESAIRLALRCKCSSISFNTAASYVGREAELDQACAALKEKFPALVEIVPSQVDTGATVYLHKKPDPLTRLVNACGGVSI
jgi:hypothetical protein